MRDTLYAGGTLPTVAADAVRDQASHVRSAAIDVRCTTSAAGAGSACSRAVSNLGSSFGASIAGTILVSDLASGNGTYVIAMVVPDA